MLLNDASIKHIKIVVDVNVHLCRDSASAVCMSNAQPTRIISHPLVIQDHVCSAAKHQRTDVSNSVMQLLLDSDYSTRLSSGASPPKVDNCWNAPNVKLQTDPLSWWKTQ